MAGGFMSSPEQTRTQLARGSAKRTKVACKSCHHRRVKCDAGDVRPCWHCRLRGTQCELIESRRGKYTRKKPVGVRSNNKSPGTPASAEPNQSAGVPTPRTALEETCSPDQPSSLAQAPSPPTTASLIPDNIQEGYDASDGPEMLYARLAESGPDAESPGFSTEQHMRSYYMGDSFSLAFIVRSLSTTSSQLKLHYPIPNNVAEHAQNSVEGLKHSDPATLAYLNMHGAFTLPPQDVSDELVYIFFNCVHPAFPVLDRQDFCALYRHGRSSVLVQQTIYFLASIVCSEASLKRAGFLDRYSARRAFYLRAKALYDMDCEKNKERLAAVLFLLGFWWEGPEDQKDTWHWLGAAIGLAQTLGMHRSTANAGMSFRQRAIWKRIWWSIYIRDRHAAASLGRPCRINDEDCDVETLDVEDFLVDNEYESELLPTEYQYHRLYVIEMAKLAVILGKLLNHEFAPCKANPQNISTELVSEHLCEWERNLPSEFHRTSVDETLSAPFWSSMLHTSYYNCQILLFRPDCRGFETQKLALLNKKARVAADAITRLVEDLLAAGTLGFGQLHLVPAIFAALSIHAVTIRSGDPIQKQLAENRARQCILGMSELAKGWPVAGWILRLFINLMKRLTGQNGSSVAGPAQLPPGTLNKDHHFGQQSTQSVPSNGNFPTYPASNTDQYLLAKNPSFNQGQEGFGLVETDQLMSDIIWGSGQNDLDFDLMLNGAQSTSMFPAHLGFLQGQGPPARTF